MTRMALSLPPESIWDTLTAFGFGQVTGSGFPGESAGLLNDHCALETHRHRDRFRLATALSVTPLQLAHAYAILGAGGISRPVTLRRVDEPVAGERVIDAARRA